MLTQPLAWPAGNFLRPPSDMEINARFEMKTTEKPEEQAGRLYFSAQPAWKRTDNAPILIVTLTAKGPARGGGVEGIFRFLDVGRDWIVRGFKDATTPEMHREWGLTNG